MIVSRHYLRCEFQDWDVDGDVIFTLGVELLWGDSREALPKLHMSLCLLNTLGLQRAQIYILLAPTVGIMNLLGALGIEQANSKT